MLDILKKYPLSKNEYRSIKCSLFIGVFLAMVFTDDNAMSAESAGELFNYLVSLQFWFLSFLKMLMLFLTVLFVSIFYD